MDDEDIHGTEADDLPDPEARRARRLAVLAELTDMGMELARIAKRQAVRDAEEDIAALPPEERTTRRDGMLAFSRIARVVRACVALEERIETGGETRRQARADAAPPVKTYPFDWRHDRRMEFIRKAFKHAARAQYGEGGEGTGRWLDMLARVDADEVREAMEAHPDEGKVAAAIANVAAATGIDIDWPRDIDTALIHLSPYRWFEPREGTGPPPLW